MREWVSFWVYTSEYFDCPASQRKSLAGWMLFQIVLIVLTGVLRSARHWKIKAVMIWWRNWLRVDYTWKTNIKLTAASTVAKLLLTIPSNMHCLMKKVFLQINLWKKNMTKHVSSMIPFDNQYLIYHRKWKTWFSSWCYSIST